MQNTIHVNTYERLGSPNVLTTIPVVDWFNKIKSSEHSELITAARKYDKGSPLYESVKKSLPCVTFNFLFDGYKTNENIQSATGLLYIDIDEVSFNIEQLDKSKVFAYYKSFGGRGYSILVQVDGLTLENYKETSIAIFTELNLLDYFDKGAVKATQFNVLSYDHDVFINPDSFVFSSLEKVYKPDVIEREKMAYTKGLYTSDKIRFNDLDTIPIEHQYRVFADKIDVVQCTIPMKAISEKRNHCLLAYCNNLIWLNPNLGIEGTMKIMMNVNIRMCATPVDNEQLKRIVNSIFKYKENGTLKPMKTKRTIVFSKECGLTGKEKFTISGKEYNKVISNGTKQKIYETIENWDFESFGKITRPKVVKQSQLHRHTVTKYWNEFEDYVEVLNNEYCGITSPVEVLVTATDTYCSVEQKRTLNGVKMTDEVICVKDLLIGLYLQAGEKIDVDAILGFMTVLNKSEARISEIVSMLARVVRENKYFNSPYSHIQVPTSVIELIREHKYGVVEFIYSEAA